MSRVEDRLRDAYQDAAGAVTPGSVRGLEERIARRATPSRRRRAAASRWGRIMTPLAAAAAVVAIIVLAAVALRPGPARPASGRTSAARPTFIIVAYRGESKLSVRDEATGALAGVVTLPDPGGAYSGTGPTSVATTDGRHYLVAIASSFCRSWLYQFTLNDQGHPGAVTAFAALPTVGSLLYDLTISANGQMIGYATSSCAGPQPQPDYLGATNVHTGKTTRWTVTGGVLVNEVSLTADGSQLCYSFPAGTAAVRIIPTSAAAGNAADRGRTVLQAAQVKRLGTLSSATISPDGKAVYYTTFPENYTTFPKQPGTFSKNPGTRWVVQARALDLATGRARVIQTIPMQRGLIAADPQVRHLLLLIDGPETVSTPPPLVPPKAALLDLSTGKISYLPSGWLTPSLDILGW